MFNAGVHKNPAISMMDLNKLNIWGHVIKIQCILIGFLIIHCYASKSDEMIINVYTVPRVNQYLKNNF